MDTISLYCHNCKKHFNVKKENIELMKSNDLSFDGKEYTKGCFFKDITKIKLSNKKEEDKPPLQY